MSKLIIAIIAIVLIVGGIVLFRSNDSATTDIAVTDKGASSSAELTTVAELFARGDDLKCTYGYTDEFGTQTGTLYFSGDKMYGEFNVTSGTEQFMAYTIRDDEFLYTWGGGTGSNAGTKIALSSLEADTANTNTSTDSRSQGLSDDQEVEFDCDSWNVSDSRFDPPSGISFTDLTAQAEQITETSDAVLETACAACDSSPDAASRDSCRQALGCS